MSNRIIKWSRFNIGKFVILPLIVLVVSYREMGSIIIKLNLTLLILATLILSVSYWAYHKLRVQKFHYTELLIIYITILCLSYFLGTLLWTSAQEYGLQKLLLLIPMIIIGLAVSDLIKKYSRFFALLIYVTAILVVLKLLLQQEVNLANQFFRLRTAEETNPIRLGSYMIFAMMSIFYIKKTSKSKPIDIIFYVSVPILLIVVFLTGSKGPIFALILVFFITYVFSNKVYNYLFIIPFLILIFNSFGFIIEYLPSEIESFYNDRFNIEAGQGAESSVSSRVDMIKFGISNLDRLGLISIIFGQGAGSFATHYSGASYPHNLFVELIFEYGLIGLVINLLIIIFFLKKYLKYTKHSNVNKYFINCAFFYYLLSLTTGSLSEAYIIPMLIFCSQSETRFDAKRIN